MLASDVALRPLYDASRPQSEALDSKNFCLLREKRCKNNCPDSELKLQIQTWTSKSLIRTCNDWWARYSVLRWNRPKALGASRSGTVLVWKPHNTFDHDKGQKSVMSGRRLHWILFF